MPITVRCLSQDVQTKAINTAVITILDDSLNQNMMKKIDILYSDFQAIQFHDSINYIWALSRENLSSGVCKQQRGRPACAFAQSDQCLCFLLFEKYHIQTCKKRNFNFLASVCTGA